MMRVAIALMMIAAPLDAQASLRTSAPLLAAPNGRELATISQGSSVQVATGSGAVRQGHTQVTLEGFIDASLLGAGRDSFPNVVAAPSGGRLRSAGRTDAAILASLRDGMGVHVVSRSGTWVRVRRTAWVESSALERTTPGSPGRAGAASTPTQTPGTPARGTGAADAPVAAGAPAASGAADSARAVMPPPAGSLTPNVRTPLRTAPDGRVTAALDSGAVLTALAREEGWVRVRVEGWVRAADVIPADSALRLALSGADLRAAPERYRGAVVRWDVEFIAMQRADQLRRDLRSGEPYVLARGPGKETGLLYIAIPPAMVAEMERYEPLQVITITARVRVGRSEPAGVPVLDLITAVRR